MLRLHPNIQTGQSQPSLVFVVGCWLFWTPWKYSCHPSPASSLSLYYWWFFLVVVVFVLFSLCSMVQWMPLFAALVSYLVLPVLIFICFIIPSLLLPPPLQKLPLLVHPCTKNDPLDSGVLGTTILLYLSSRCIVFGRDLWYRLFLLVKPFCRSAFNLLCWFLLYLSSA